MKERALGNIETYGLVPAIEAADAALKAANVELIKFEYVRAGLVTIFIVGDVSAVQSAVDAGKAAAERIGTVISTNVIARMADSLDKIIFDDIDDIDEIEEEILETEELEEPEEEILENEESEKLEKTEEVESEEDVSNRIIMKFKGKDINIFSEDQLDNLKVTELRKLVRKIDGIKMDNEEIKYGRKQELIDALRDYAKEVSIDDRI